MTRPTTAGERRHRWFVKAGRTALVPIPGGRRRALSSVEQGVAVAVIDAAFAEGDEELRLSSTVAVLCMAAREAGIVEPDLICAVLMLDTLDVLVAAEVVVIDHCDGGYLTLHLVQPRGHPLGDAREQVLGDKREHLQPRPTSPGERHAQPSLRPTPARTGRRAPPRRAPSTSSRRRR